MRRKRFEKLKKKLREMGLCPCPYLAEVIGMNPFRLQKMMQGATPWRLKEVYAIMAVIQEPVRKMTVYFPPEDMGADISVKADEEFELLKDRETRLHELAELIQSRLTELEDAV